MATVMYLGIMFLAVYLTFRIENNFPRLSFLSSQKVGFYACLEVAIGLLLLYAPTSILGETGLYLFMLYAFAMLYWGLPAGLIGTALLTGLAYLLQRGFPQSEVLLGQNLAVMVSGALLLLLVKNKWNDFQKLLGLAFCAALADSFALFYREQVYDFSLMYLLLNMLAFLIAGILYLFIRDLMRVKAAIDMDVLTHVYNLSKFHRDLADLDKRQLDPIAVVLIDIDFFKKHNDQFGHDAGDVVLKSIAQRLRIYFDSEASTVYRIGGDEFAVLMAEGSLSKIEERLTLMADSIPKQDILYSGNPISVSLSSGVAKRLEGESPTDTVKRASQALCTAKEKGRGCIEITPSLWAEETRDLKSG